MNYYNDHLTFEVNNDRMHLAGKNIVSSKSFEFLYVCSQKYYQNAGSEFPLLLSKLPIKLNYISNTYTKL